MAHFYVVFQGSEFQILSFYCLEHMISEIIMPILIKEAEEEQQQKNLEDHAWTFSMDSPMGDTHHL